ncbi:MAG: hypothetical protein ACRDRN_21685 [Sciscionella sp.]
MEHSGFQLGRRGFLTGIAMTAPRRAEGGFGIGLHEFIGEARGGCAPHDGGEQLGLLSKWVDPLLHR